MHVSRVTAWLEGRDPVSLLLALLVTQVALGAALLAYHDLVPAALLILPQILGSLVLPYRHAVVLVSATTGLVAVEALLSSDHVLQVLSGVVVVISGVISLLYVRTRERTGLGYEGIELFAEIRDRLGAQGDIPDVPPDWSVHTVLESASGGGLRGDFLVVTPAREVHGIEIVLVDVSGSGIRAATRAAQLAGAFGGILGSVPSADFLTAANDYVNRQHWDEWFATAIHVTLDFDRSVAVVRTAGHPPALWGSAGRSSSATPTDAAARWQQVRAGGPPLGIVRRARFGSTECPLGVGDMLLLFSDGVVEEAALDLDAGMSRLAASADRLAAALPSLGQGAQDEARALLATVGQPGGDDRALVVIRRKAPRTHDHGSV